MNNPLERVNETQILLAPTLAWFAVFLIGPLAVIVVYSFLTYQSFDVVWDFTTAPYMDAVFTSSTLSVFVQTMAKAFATTVLALILAYPVAYYLRFHMSQNAGIFFLTFMVIVFYTSLVIRAVAWFAVLGRLGVVNQTLIAVGVIEEPLSWLLFSPFAEIVAFLENLIVFMIAAIYISLSRIDEDLLDASETLRGNPIQTFRHVVWPLSLPGVAIGSIFVFVVAAGDFLIPQILGGGEASVTSVIFSWISPSLNYPRAAAVSIVLLITIFAPVYVLLQVVDITEISDM